jgi:hypothetical protein
MEATSFSELCRKADSCANKTWNPSSLASGGRIRRFVLEYTGAAQQKTYSGQFCWNMALPCPALPCPALPCPALERLLLYVKDVVFHFNNFVMLLKGMIDHP